MGIKNLNRFIRETCKQSKNCIQRIHLRELEGKRIAIDISIYLYKYTALIENIYLMLSIFKHYGIIPIFIFDGKPPTEKKTLLEQRKTKKVEAEKEYNELKHELYNNPKNDLSPEDKEEIKASLDLLKRQFIYIKREQIKQVKELILSYGALYYDACGEADVLCAQLVVSGKVWACMSEDMDLFVYGTSRVLRYFSLMNHTVVVYHTEQILKRLNMSQVEFRMICALANNDYNVNVNVSKNGTGVVGEFDLYRIMKLYKHYKNTNRKNMHNEYNEFNESNMVDFYTWFVANQEENFCKSADDLLQKYEMFVLPPIKEDEYAITMDEENECDYNKLQEILTEHGFVFLT